MVVWLGISERAIVPGCTITEACKICKSRWPLKDPLEKYPWSIWMQRFGCITKYIYQHDGEMQIPQDPCMVPGIFTYIYCKNPSFSPRKELYRSSHGSYGFLASTFEAEVLHWRRGGFGVNGNVQCPKTRYIWGEIIPIRVKWPQKAIYRVITPVKPIYFRPFIGAT